MGLVMNVKRIFLPLILMLETQKIKDVLNDELNQKCLASTKKCLEDSRKIMDEAKEQIKQIRAGLNLTQKEFAGAIGCSIRSIQNWEQGERKPSKIAVAAMERYRSQSQINTWQLWESSQS